MTKTASPETSCASPSPSSTLLSATSPAISPRHARHVPMRRARAPTWCCSPSSSSPVIRRRTWSKAGVPARLRACGRGAGRRHGGRRTGLRRRHAAEAQERRAQLCRHCRWRQAARPSATRSTCPTTASSTRSACSRPARTCRVRSISAASASASRSARTSGAIWASARRSPKAAPRSCWCPTARPIIAARSRCASRWSSAK